ncbi:MAG: SRPBCC domain-containing protein [Mycobacteriales bacterium]
MTVLNDTTVVSETVEIDAPQELVWQVLTDYARYPEWNPYTVKVETTLEVGARVVLHLPDPAKPGETFQTVEWMSVVDAPHHLQYHTATEMPGIHAVRDQWVEDLGAGRSSYRTTDVFTGEIAAMVFELQGAWVKQGFDATAHALKARAEALHRAS